MSSDVAHVNSASEGSFAERSLARVVRAKDEAGTVEETSNRVLSGWRV